MASPFGGLLEGFNQGQQSRRANRQLDIRQQQADTDRARVGINDRRQQETARHNKQAEMLNTFTKFTTAITDRDLPDAVRIKTQNELNNFLGISGQVFSIEDIDKTEPVLKKINNTKARFAKGEISQKEYLVRLRGLESEYKVALGESDAFEGEIAGIASEDKATFDRDALQMAQVLAKKIGGDTSINPQDGEIMARLNAKYKNNPDGWKQLIQDAQVKVATLQQGRREKLSVGIRDELAADKDELIREALERANISKGRVAASGATQVNLGTSTRSKLEKDIISADSNIEGFNNIELSFKPEFLTLAGKAKAGTQRQLDKLGFSNNTEFLQSRAAWFSQAMSAFIAYRKWATGVAGGEKEMAQIAKAFPDPEKNSPAEYISNLKQSRITARKLKARLTMFRAGGIESPTKEQLSSIPLESIPDADSDEALTPEEKSELQELLGDSP